VLLAALVLAGVPCARGWQPGEKQDMAVVLEAERPTAERRQAAQSLLRGEVGSEAANAVARVLRDEATDPEAVVLLLGAIEGHGSPPGALFEPVGALFDSDDERVRVAALRAAGAFRSKRAVRALVGALGRVESGGAREAAWSSLVRLTGRDDLGREAGAWEAWLAGVDPLSDGAFHARLAEGLAARADRLSARLRARLDEMVRLHREDYLRREGGEARSRKLAELMLHEEPSLRSLGFDLARRELASATSSLNGEVSGAAASLLDHPDVEVRRKAASLLSQMAATNVIGHVVSALSEERDPAVAAALLDCAARSPVPGLGEPAVAWAERGGTGASAHRALLALVEADLLEKEALRARAVVALRSRGAAELDPAGLEALLLLGGKAARRAVLDLVWSSEEERRRLAASVLASHPWAADHLREAAERWPELLPVAAGAIPAGELAGPKGMRRLIALAEGNWANRVEMRAGLGRLASALPTRELVLVAARPGLGSAAREAVLAPVAERAETAERVPGGGIETGLVMLARARLELGNASGAFAALELLPQDEGVGATEEVRRLRVVSLVATGATERAEELGAPAGWWIEGLELAAEQPHARGVLEEIRTRFGEALTDEERERLRAIEVGLPAAAAAADEAASEGPESPPG